MDARSTELYNLLLRLGPMANQEIANLLDLSPATITHLIQTREHAGMLMELPSQDYPQDVLQHHDVNHRTRRKTTFRPNPGFASTLILYCSGSMLHFYRASFDLVLEDAELGMLELVSPEQAIRETRDFVATLMRASATPITAISLIVPWHASASCFPDDFPDTLGAELRKSTLLSLKLSRSGRALALYEAYAGMARHLDHFIALHIHENIELGIFLNGQLFDPIEMCRAGDIGAWELSPGFRLSEHIGRPAINARLEELGYRVEHHETYRILQQALGHHCAGSPVETLVVDLADTVARLVFNLSLAFSPERIFLYSPLNELDENFSLPLFEALDGLTGQPDSGSWSSRLVLGDDWKPAMATGAAKAAFDLWLSTPARNSVLPEASTDPVMTD